MPSSLTQQSIINQLGQELSKLKDKLQMAHELKVEWLTNDNSEKSGSLRQNNIQYALKI
jgi:hypothetical protein